jgi:hypothetical protein
MRRALMHVMPMIALAGVLVMPLPAFAEPELEGMYLARGVNADGSQYQFVVEIAKFREVFIVMTTIADASEEGVRPTLAAIGIGIRNGDVLSVGDYTPDSARVVSYRIEDGGRRLAGRWTYVDGDGTVHEETLTKLERTLDTRGRAVQ